MGTVRRYIGESIFLHKARWEEDGGLGEGGTFAREPATEGGRRPCPLRRRELRASTAGQGPSFPQKTCLHMEEAQGGHAGDHAGVGQLAVEEAEALQFAFAQAEGQAFVVIDGQFFAGQGAAVAGEV